MIEKSQVKPWRTLVDVQARIGRCDWHIWDGIKAVTRDAAADGWMVSEQCSCQTL